MAASKRKQISFHYENPVDSEIEFDSATSKKKSKTKNKSNIDQTTRFLTRWPGDVSNTLQRSTIRQRSTPNLNSALNQLPDEIILMILSYLNKASLVCFARTCRRFRSIAYHSVLWRRLDLSHKRIDSEQLINLLQRGTVTLKMFQTTIEENDFVPTRTICLKQLDLTLANISNDFLNSLLDACRSLRKLSLESVPLNEKIIEKVMLNEQLDTLNIAMCTGLPSEFGQILTNKLSLLRSLNVAWTNLSMETIRSLCESMPRCIEQLNMSGHRYSLKDEHIFSLVRRAVRLRSLDISDSALITDQSIVALRNHCCLLVHLSASRCYALTSGTLVSLKLLTAFSSLDIFGTLPVTALQQLREDLGPRIRLNMSPFSIIARPTTGIQRTSIWGLRTRS